MVVAEPARETIRWHNGVRPLDGDNNMVERRGRRSADQQRWIVFGSKCQVLIDMLCITSTYTNKHRVVIITCETSNVATDS